MDQQFLDVIDVEEAGRRFHAALSLAPLAEECVPLDEALGRVLACDVAAPIDVPGFDRSNVDGFAVRAADTFGAMEESPRGLALTGDAVPVGATPPPPLRPGEATNIVTGGMLPRGADAVLMLEHADVDSRRLWARRPVTPAANVTFAGTDIAQGEVVLRAGQVLSSRETGVLAALGIAEVRVFRRPRVAILSTGDELLPPGAPIALGMVFDSNGQILADAVRELGAEPIRFGIVPDDRDQLARQVRRALAQADVVLLSGGTSKGAGDLSYQVVGELSEPGIVAHGVALKPGKPLCLAASQGKPVVVLPGFPTSAIFTFHEFVAPVLRRLAARAEPRHERLRAQLAVRVLSDVGRTEYLLVGLVPPAHASALPAAFPLGKGSGSVTTFSAADGFMAIGRGEELIEAGTLVEVTLLGRERTLADLVIIGSHCIGLDYLVGELQRRGLRCKTIAVGSTAGLDAAARGECDLAGIHLLDPASGQYNGTLLPAGVELIRGYGRMQGVVFRQGDERFAGRSAAEAVAFVRSLGDCVMINRNAGSGTRVLVDELLGGARPPGYAVQPRSHRAVVAAVIQGRADWGVAIQTAVTDPRLGFLPLAAEQFDFATPTARSHRPAVRAFRELLAESGVREHLARLGFLL